MRNFICCIVFLWGSIVPALALSEQEGLRLYQQGRYKEAITHWEKAAAQGDAGAAYRLAEEYFDAKIVKRDLARVIAYLEQAVAKGDARAMAELGSHYDYGTGVRQDTDKAAELYLQAAQYGIPQAMFNIAAMLETGEGIDYDAVEAYKFYLLARDRGFAPFAVSALTALEATMSANDVAEAVRRAKDFQPLSF